MCIYKQQLKLSDGNSADIGFTEHKYDHDRQFYIGMLSEELEVGKNYTLSMDFTGYLNDKLHGFYRSVYTDIDGNKK